MSTGYVIWKWCVLWPALLFWATVNRLGMLGEKWALQTQVAALRAMTELQAEASERILREMPRGM